MRDLKRIGAHNVAVGRLRGLTGKQQFTRVRAAYLTQARDGRVPATFEVVYGHAWAPGGDTPAHTAGVPMTRVARRRPS
jgi:malonyl-CoA O-methyltransferase